jgi:predicted metalloprotease with PDZ domain
VDDLRVTLGETVRDTAFANDFFRRCITGRDAPDYATLLARAGILVRPARSGSPTIGAPRLNTEGGSVIVAGPVLVGTSLYEAGVAPGDRIVAIDGRTVDSADALTAIVNGKRPGEPIEITFEQRRVRRTAAVPTGEDRALEVLLYEKAGRELTDAMRQFRSAWLAAKAR